MLYADCSLGGLMLSQLAKISHPHVRGGIRTTRHHNRGRASGYLKDTQVC